MRVEGDTTPCDEQQIHAILKRRLQCKMSRQFQEADQLRDQLSALGVMVHDREKTWEVKPGFGGAPAQGAYGGNNFGAQPGQYAGKPPADYYSAPTGAGGFSSAPPSLNDMATDAQKRIAAAQQAAAAASAGIPPTVAPTGATPYPPPPQRAPAPAPPAARGRSNSDSSSSSSSRSRSRSRERKPGAIPRKGDAAAAAPAPAGDDEKKAD